MKGSITVNFRPSTVENGLGTVFYRIIYNRVVKTIRCAKIENGSWLGKPSKFTKLEVVNKKIDYDLEKFRKLEQCLLWNPNKEYSVDQIAEVFENDRFNLVNYTLRIGQMLSKAKRSSTGTHYILLAGKLKQFINGKYVSIIDINASFVEAFENFLWGESLCKNTSSFYLRLLRAVYNRAVENEEIPTPLINPFKKCFTGNAETIKRALSLEDLRKVKDVDLSKNDELQFARDMFMFSFYTRGMNLIDMANLKAENLYDDTLTYIRRKTGQFFCCKVEDEAQDIIDRYHRENSDLLFPIMDKIEYKTMLTKINASLKTIQKKCAIGGNLTFYAARHSWASIAMNNANIPVSIISKGMGHTSEETTKIYLASFKVDKIDKANRRVLDLF